MKFGVNKMLGLAVGERSILIAEVAVEEGSRKVLRASEFIYAAGITLQQPEILGKGLRQFLQREHYSARSAVFGIPAKAVLTKSKELPPVDPSLASEMIRIQVESEFSSELKELVHDYAGQSSRSGPATVFLAATPQKYIGQIEAIAEAARLEVQGITPTALCLSAAANQGNGDAVVLSITRSGTELAARRDATPVLLRHVGASSAVNAILIGEVRRATLQLPRSSTSASNGNSNGSGSIVIWDDVSDDMTHQHAWSEALGFGARNGEWDSLGAGDLPAGESRSAAAVCLAVAGLSGGGLSIDFAHPRLAPPKKSGMRRQTGLAIAAGLIVILGIIGAYVDLQHKEDKLAVMKSTLVAMESKRVAAEAEVAKIKYAQGWHADTPRYLACVRDLTLAIPDDSTMFITSFAIHDSMKGALSGKATTDKSVLTLVERLKGGRHFSDVKIGIDAREAKNVREVSFSISFDYLPHD